MSEPILKSLVVNGEEYNYFMKKSNNGVEYPHTAFVKIPINENYFKMFDGKGGLVKKVLHDQIEGAIDGYMTLISLSTDGYHSKTDYLYEIGDRKIYLGTTIDEKFLSYLIDLLEENEHLIGKIEIENSLDYINHKDYGQYMDDYKQPESPKHSGLTYQNRPILFGEKFTMTGLSNLMDKMGGDLLRAVKHGGVDSMRVSVNSRVSAFNLVSQQTLIKPDGTVYTLLDEQKAIHPNKTDLQIIEDDVDEWLENANSSTLTREKATKQVAKDMGERVTILLPIQAMNDILDQDGIEVIFD